MPQLVGDANSGSHVPYFDLVNSTSTTLSWATTPNDLFNIGITGVQVIVDDILRLSNYTGNNITLAQVGLGASTGIEHYFRLAVSLL